MFTDFKVCTSQFSWNEQQHICHIPFWKYPLVDLFLTNVDLFGYLVLPLSTSHICMGSIFIVSSDTSYTRQVVVVAYYPKAISRAHTYTRRQTAMDMVMGVMVIEELPGCVCVCVCCVGEMRGALSRAMPLEVHWSAVQRPGFKVEHDQALWEFITVRLSAYDLCMYWRVGRHLRMTKIWKGIIRMTELWVRFFLLQVFQDNSKWLWVGNSHRYICCDGCYGWCHASG
jgi:hypothetical protein